MIHSTSFRFQSFFLLFTRRFPKWEWKLRFRAHKLRCFQRKLNIFHIFFYHFKIYFNLNYRSEQKRRGNWFVVDVDLTVSASWCSGKVIRMQGIAPATFVESSLFTSSLQLHDAKKENCALLNIAHGRYENHQWSPIQREDKTQWSSLPLLILFSNCDFNEKLEI